MFSDDSTSSEAWSPPDINGLGFLGKRDKGGSGNEPLKKTMHKIKNRDTQCANCGKAIKKSTGNGKYCQVKDGGCFETRKEIIFKPGSKGGKLGEWRAKRVFAIDRDKGYVRYVDQNLLENSCMSII